jgi:hypothetical protein
MVKLYRMLHVKIPLKHLTDMGCAGATGTGNQTIQVLSEQLSSLEFVVMMDIR